MQKEKSYNVLRRFLFVLATMLFLSCSESKKENTTTSSVDTTATITTVTPIEESQSNCYNHLTELVRSSSFPFKSIDKSDINLLIDTDEDGVIFAKVFFETEGTGTLGWVNYHVKTRKLENASADLEVPQKLTFNEEYATSFEKCLGIRYISPPQDSTECFVSISDFELPFDTEALRQTNTKTHELACQIQELEKFRCGNEAISYYVLSVRESYKYVIFPEQCGDSEFQTLAILKDNRVVDQLLISQVAEAEINGKMGLNYIEFTIDKNYVIHLVHSTSTAGYKDRKVTKEEDVIITVDGKFQRR